MIPPPRLLRGLQSAHSGQLASTPDRWRERNEISKGSGVFWQGPVSDGEPQQRTGGQQTERSLDWERCRAQGPDWWAGQEPALSFLRYTRVKHNTGGMRPRLERKRGPHHPFQHDLVHHLRNLSPPSHHGVPDRGSRAWAAGLSAVQRR